MGRTRTSLGILAFLLWLARSAAAEPPVEASSHPVSVSAGFAFGVLNLPNFGGGLTLGVRVAPRYWWPIEVGGIYWFENEDVLTSSEVDLHVHPALLVEHPAGGSSLLFDMWQASLATCPHETAVSGGTLSVCAGGFGGVVGVEGIGFFRGRTLTRGHFSLEAYVRWRFRLTSMLGLTYSAGVFVPLVRDSFGYRDRAGNFRELFRPPPLGGRLDLALGVTL